VGTVEDGGANFDDNADLETLAMSQGNYPEHLHSCLHHPPGETLTGNVHCQRGRDYLY